jgi:hypothetical protein
MTEADRSRLRVHTVDGAFGLVAGAFCSALSRSCRRFRRGPRRRRGAAEAADRRFQIAFGVDQEVGRHHHLLARLHALDDLHIGVAARAKLDLTRLEAPFAFLDQHDLARAAVDDGRHRHGDHRALGRDGHLDLREHGRLEQQAGVGQFHPDRHGARLRLERRIDVGHLALEQLVGVGIDPDLRCGTGLDQPDILLEDIGDHPDRGQVGHLVERFAGHEAHALDRLFLGHDSRGRGTEGQGAFRFTGAGQCLDLLVGDVPAAQALQARLGELLHAGLCRPAGVFQRGHALHGDGVLALG